MISKPSIGFLRSTRFIAAAVRVSATQGAVARLHTSMGPFTEPDQKKRTAMYKAENNQRVLDITTVYDGSSLKGKTVLVTGGNGGLGLELCKELVRQGASVVSTIWEPSEEKMPKLDGDVQTITKVDVTSDDAMVHMVEALNGKKINILINNAGYFMREPENIDSLNFKEEMKTIDICACGPLRVAGALVNAGLMVKGSKIGNITSQGGSIAWREVQNKGGPYDYGHHMSKCAANMMSRLLAMELESYGIPVIALHPGFNKTPMTQKYADIWEEEGAVDPVCGAKRVLHEIIELTPEKTGIFVNTEDGKQIPW